MTYRECYTKGNVILESAEVPEAELNARLLLEFVCGTNRNTLLAHGDREVTAQEQVVFEELIKKRAERIPLQHLTGTQNFMGLDFEVNEHVLIPRQDTEILVEEALKELQDGMHVLDMCTGSGCILLSLLHYSNLCTGVGADLSEEALAVATRNAARLLQDEKSQAVQFVRGNLFENVSGKFEMIVSNPPYIAKNVIPGLMPEVREHEPWMALDGGEDGLDFYREIIAQSCGYLKGGGMLFLEIGYDQGQAVTGIMEASGYQEIRIVPDYAGLDRVVWGIWIA